MTETGLPAAWATKLQNIWDRQEILDCLQRISRGMDRFDKAAFLSGYHADAIVDAGSIVSGPEGAYETAAAGHAHGQIFTLHNLLNHVCEIDGEVAHAETYWLYNGLNRDQTNWAAGGRYIDRLEKRGGAWRIAFRRTVLEWSGMIPAVRVPLFEGVADLHGNGTPARDKSDPSYARPYANRRAMTLPENAEGLGTPG
jgi:hypothetical protein